MQAKDVKPTYKKEGKLVLYTSFHENGSISQTGYFKNNKVTGTWKKFDKEGKKIALANYNEGKKTGKWFFWTKEGLKEVNYDNNKIVSVKSWKEGNTVAIN